MEKQFVTYEIALKLKELGFDEPCFGYFEFKDKNLKLFSDKIQDASCNSDIVYDDFIHCTAPLWQQAIDWLREKHRFHFIIEPLNTKNKILDYSFGFSSKTQIYSICDFYENARKQAILKAIKIIKK